MTTPQHRMAANPRHAQSTQGTAPNPVEAQARAAAQKAYDEVMAGGRAGFSSGHSRLAGAAVSAHADERKKTIDASVASHRIPEARRTHYAGLYDKDPAGTKSLLSSLEPVPALSALAGKKTPAGRLSTAASPKADETGFLADDPLPLGLSLLNGKEWTDHARQLRDRQDLEGFAATASHESLGTQKERLAHAAIRRDRARLNG